MTLRFLHSCLAIGILAVLAGHATAAPGDPDEEADDGPRFEARVAAGPGVLPEYEGSRHYEPVPYAEAQIYYGGYHVKINGLRLRANLVPHGPINAGPVMSFNRGRSSVSSDRVNRLGKINPALELGGFVEYLRRDPDDPMSAARIRLAVRQDVTDSHGGMVATLRGTVQHHVFLGTVVAVSADASWASGDYMDTFFSVSEAGAERSGFSAFNAGAGVKNVGIALAMDQFLSRTWSVGARVHYSRLLGDASDSPVVDDAGSPDQVFATVVAGYRF